MDDAERAEREGGGIETELARRAVTELRSDLSTTVHRIAEDSAQEVYSAGQSMQAILGHAGKLAGALREVLARVDQKAGGDATVGAALAAQHDLVETFVAEMLVEVRAQSEVSEKAASMTAAIVELARTTASIEMQFRILTLNIRVEAARLGSAGAAVGVIANELNALSRNVGQVNTDIGKTAKELSALLPVIGQTASRVQKKGTSFQRDVTERGAEVSERWSGLLGHLQGAVAQGEARTAKMLSLSREAITHLQFQDPMAQELLRLEALVDRLEQRVGLADRRVDANDDGTAEGDSGGGPALDGGEMLLF